MPPHLEASPIVLRLGRHVRLDDDRFLEVCELNRDLRIERTAEGEIVVMPPTGGATGSRNAALTSQLYVWATADGTGVAFDSSTGFRLPNGAIRSPDSSWVKRERLGALGEQTKERFLPLCPDFVVELRSPSDELSLVRTKMNEYLECGAELGWLIDPSRRRVEVYRPGENVVHLDDPSEVAAAPLLSGFVLDLRPIVEPGI